MTTESPVLAAATAIEALLDSETIQVSTEAGEYLTEVLNRLNETGEQPEFRLDVMYWGQQKPQSVYSTDENTLRTLGLDHHTAAKIPPTLKLHSPDEQIIATMDEWASDWTETGA